MTTKDTEKLLVDEGKKKAARDVAPPTPPLPPEPPVALPAVETAPAAAAPSRFRVGRNITIPWNGQLIKLRAGQLVSDDSYGDGAMARFRDRGVALEPAP